MARKTKEELDQLCKQYRVPVLDSWSKYHCYKQDKYEAFLKYVLHKPEDRTNGIYAISGGAVHDILEKYYSEQITYEDMINQYEDALLTMNIAELKYNRSDAEKNDRIANKYENSIKHFFTHHKPITAPHTVESFVAIRVCDDIVLQGYIDFFYREMKGEKPMFTILDFKSSSIYRGNKIKQECGQLLIYAEGIRQLFKMEDFSQIKCVWNFLKYTTVKYEQKNGKIKERHIERNAIGESLVNAVKMWLKHFEYDEEKINEYIESMILENHLDMLPEEVREKFVFGDCIVEVPLIQQEIDDLKQDIADTIHEFREKADQYGKSHDEMLFWQDVTDADAFRLATLSGYSRELHKPYDEYLKNQEVFMKKQEMTEDDELLELLKSL